MASKYIIFIFLVSGYGPRDWEQRLERALSDCFERQCTVAVLADFKGRPTPGGIGLIKSEYPETKYGLNR